MTTIILSFGETVYRVHIGDLFMKQWSRLPNHPQPSPAEAGELLMIASVHCIQCGQTVPGNTQWGYRAARQDSRSFIEIIIIEFIQLE